MSKASGIHVRIHIKMGEDNRTDTPALGAAIADLRREGWHLKEYESGQQDREAFAVLTRSWDISVHRSAVNGEYAMEVAEQ